MTDENRRQSQYSWRLLAIIALTLLATAYVTQDLYAHPTRPSDCDATVDYAATCARATAPTPASPPDLIVIYLGTLGAALLAVLLVQAGWSASVTRQVEIVTAFAGAAVAKPPLDRAGSASRPHPVAGVDDAAAGKPTPTAILNNSIVPGMIAPPKAEPKKGVDAKAVGGAK